MSIGQRIAQRRKELGLSQEALGEQLGVSRQSIYKWESGTALPEIDKLVALSRLFGVSVGWLLGVEENGTQEAQAPGTAAPGTEAELSEAQLKMVEEIVGRYLAAQPSPKKSTWNKWSVRFLFCVCGAILGIVFGISSNVKQLDNRYQNLQNSVSNITHSVNSQINGISTRVEEILKSQNDLTAEYGAELSRVNLKENRVLFSVHATPRTYIEGMTVKFAVDNHSGSINKTPGEESTNHSFTGTLATQLTDEITLSVTLIYPDGRQETQVLDTFSGLLSASFPEVDIRDQELFAKEVPNGTLTLDDFYVTTRSGEAKSFQGSPSAQVSTVQVGLFRNQRLLAWAQPSQQPSSYRGSFQDSDFYRFSPMTVEHLTAGDTLAVAALVTDSYGRQFIACRVPYIVNFDTNDDAPYLTYPSDGRYDRDPANWVFDQ